MVRKIEPNVYKRLHDLNDLVSSVKNERFGYEMAWACYEISSPIEQMLLMSLMAIKEVEIDYSKFSITPQFKVGKFSVDFLLSTGSVSLAVECDGHEFHDKTKQQRTYEKQRERKILQAGFKIIRFTGSEIYKDSLACASEALSILYDCQHEKMIGCALFDELEFRAL